MAIDMNDLTNNLTSFANGLGKLFGQNCEVVLFSSKESDHELIFITNNCVTGRTYGDTMNHYELEALNKAEVHNGYTIFSYITKEGRSIKAALFVIKDRTNEDSVIIVVSFDVTDILLASKIFQSFCNVDETTEFKHKDNIKKDNDNITSLMHGLVSDVIEEIGKPIPYLNKDDKLKIVSTLSKKDVFLIKGSIEYVAERLCVSRYTIYNYLEELR